MPNFAPFIPVDSLPVDGEQMGRTVTLRQGGTDTPYIWKRLNGVNQWVVFGERGPQGVPGEAGSAGSPGISAYQVAVSQGYSGTITQWLQSLIGATGSVGPQGPPGLPASLVPFLLPARPVVAAYAIVRGVDYHIACDMTIGPYAVTLPATPVNGERYEVTKFKGTGVLTVNRNGNQMDGGNVSPTISANHTARFAFVTGLGWISTECDVA